MARHVCIVASVLLKLVASTIATTFTASLSPLLGKEKQNVNKIVDSNACQNTAMYVAFVCVQYIVTYYCMLLLFMVHILL